MHIRFVLPLSLGFSLLVTISACQSGVHQVNMDGTSNHDVGCVIDRGNIFPKISHMPTNSLQLMDIDNTSMQTSSTTSSPSNSSGIMSAQVPVDQDVFSDTAASAEIIDKSITQEVFKGSDENHKAWFKSFSSIIDYTEGWDAVADILKKGKELGYLNQCIAWEDDAYTPLHYAAQKGELEIVQELIEVYDVSVAIRTNIYGRTPSHLAALRGELEVVKYLIERDENWQLFFDNEDASILQYAALGTRGRKNMEVVIFLKDKGANLEEIKKGFSLLHLAIEADNSALVDYLLRYHSCLVSSSECTISSLQYARDRERLAIVDKIECALRL